MKFSHIYLPAFAVIWLGLCIDSVWLAAFSNHGQEITFVLVIAVFLWIWKHVSKVPKQLMLYCVFITYIGEITMSLGLGMYTYRLENVPHYVPLGHAIVYAAVYYIAKEPWVRSHKNTIINTLLIAMVAYSTFWLVIADDWLGFLCTLLILALFIQYPKTKLFFLIMFFMVVYLELIGTYFQCWVWPPVAFDVMTWLPSANPPSGIGVGYFVFDGLCLFAYKLFHFKKWQRFRSIQKASA